ncbi:hypothetical protein [Rhizobium favelukesii]|uniref:hypothetical protein n=1 Tax=Rhizobium favelukesii TaxID=348824 RepID=UPI0003F4E4FB|nr:hypothetical protein [Rhizobium favelukesii]MCS0459208.1 hypothetical protein [Rhizobium favelukesii]
MLRAAVRDDGTPLNALYPIPAPEDQEAWRRLQIAADAHYADALRGTTDETKVAIETLRLARQPFTSRRRTVFGSEIASLSICMAARWFSAVATPVAGAPGCRQTCLA